MIMKLRMKAWAYADWHVEYKFLPDLCVDDILIKTHIKKTPPLEGATLIGALEIPLNKLLKALTISILHIENIN